MNVTSPKGASYEVGELLGKTERFNLYVCSLPDGKNGILKVAASREENEGLEREAFILKVMRDEADRIEVEAQRREPGKGELGYRHFFPELVESFVSRDQGGRRIIILSLSEVTDDLGNLVPLAHILLRDKKRVDPKTSVWILGRLLKLLAFAHDIGISVTLHGENILINREEHFVTVFDWSETSIDREKITSEQASEEIAAAAKETVSALGGDLDAETIPDDPQLTDERYREVIFSLAKGEEADAHSAHRRFYKTVRALWPGKFHPFTAYPVKAIETAAHAEETEET